MTEISRRTTLKSAALAAVAMLMSAVLPAEARPTASWRDAFQSSPAAYEAFSPDFARKLIEQFKLPPEMFERFKPRPPVAGTLRCRFAVSVAGSQLRIRLSNEEGTKPLHVAAASIGLAGEGHVVQSGTLKPLTFGGKRSVTIPAGAPVLSDPVDIAVVAGSELLASVHLQDGIQLDPRGSNGMALAAGDQTLMPAMEQSSIVSGRPLISGAEVLTRSATRVIATLGDSITDGNRDRIGELRSWPEELARRLAARKRGKPYSVVDAAIGGNRVLAPGWGPAALARLDRDVLRIEGLSHLIVLEGTNDIGMSGKSIFGDSPLVSADDLIAGYRQIIARAHARNVKVVLATILPFGGAMTHYSVDKEQVRQAANAWMRTSGEADAVIDFDQIARDPENPLNMRSEFKSADHLHPGEAGYKIMGDAIDLSIFN
jgi:lysophospholipase L1-like esterase